MPLLTFIAETIILAIELLNPPGRINQLLLAGEKRMTCRADFYFDITRCRAGFKSITAGTSDDGFFIFWVNFGLHE
jgi:hypothetical protein